MSSELENKRALNSHRDAPIEGVSDYQVWRSLWVFMAELRMQLAYSQLPEDKREKIREHMEKLRRVYPEVYSSTISKYFIP